ncbi:hypothetical protein [Ferruginibacter sp. SUN106]|uniref:hypothetical protein n=1 Tax=Ferruginibacter sp. SUN106 TaxID=2978348 RepID=UPI003D3677B3
MPSLTKALCYCCIVFMVSAPVTTTAQAIENSINLYGADFPQEKIHIHFDKEAYLPGETIWFKAYLFEEYLPSTRSTNFYTSLYDENGKLVQQLLCPIFNGTADGHFQIPDSLQSKQVICRAYTTWMMNFDTTFLFTKAIRLINNNAIDNSKQIKTVSLQFFPEGGDIIAGTKNTLAFKANYNNGLPFDINAVLKKQETGEVVTSVTSVHDGMGRFDIDLAFNEKFYLEWSDDKGNKQQTYLPNAKAAGVSLKLIQLKNSIVFNLVNKLPADSLHVLMYMYQKVFYKKDIAVTSTEPYTGTVPVNTLPTGIMQLTVFDANWKPVAERVAFINNNNYTINTIISNKEINTAKRGRNIIEIAIADTIPSNMSLSITDADMNDGTVGSTIVTNLLLSGDVKGYIHNPAYYFTSDKEATSNLDLVMLTHGWRRYNWDNILAARMPELKYPQDNYLSIYGQVGNAALQKIDSAEIVNLIVKTKDSTQNFYFTKPDADGLIKQTGLLFYDSAKVQYSFNKNKVLNPQITFSTSNYTYPQPATINNAIIFLKPDTTGTTVNQQASVFGYYVKDNAIKQFNKEKTMQAVLVKSGGWHNWKNDPMFKMDEKYTTMFKGMGATTWSIDVLHDEMADAKQDIYNYMIGKIPGLIIEYKGGGKSFGKTLIFVNESEIDNQILETINLDAIAYIKVYDHTPWRQGLPQSICIYLKKGDDLIDRRPKDTDLKSVKIPGYSPVKEFYAPDYSQSNTTGTDARTTLLWLPYIVTDATNQKVPVTFYNNDFTKKIRIVLEGFNDEGKLIHVEKIIE